MATCSITQEEDEEYTIITQEELYEINEIISTQDLPTAIKKPGDCNQQEEQKSELFTNNTQTDALDDEFYIIGQDELDEIKDVLSTQDMSIAISKIKDLLQQQDHVELNIAVIGEPGSGKTSFINAFRGLRDEDEGSAKIDTAMESEVYIHPKYKNVKLWDLPGIGTPSFQANEYLERVNFERYDFFIIIIASDGFKECHTQLAKEIISLEKKCYFVCTQLDIERKNSVDSDGSSFTEENIFDNFTELQNIGIEDPVVFLVSCRDLSKYDFNLLMERMEKDLPYHKRHVLMLTFPNIVLDINDKKKKALEKNISKVSLLSACAAAVPFPGLSIAVDLVIVQKEIEKYYSAFDLDDSSLQMLCEKSGKTIEELKNVMKSPLHSGINPTSILSLLGAASLYVSESAIEYYCSLIPVLGTVVAGGISFVTVSRMLKKSLDEVAEDAKNLLLAQVTDAP